MYEKESLRDQVHAPWAWICCGKRTYGASFDYCKELSEDNLHKDEWQREQAAITALSLRVGHSIVHDFTDMKGIVVSKFFYVISCITAVGLSVWGLGSRHSMSKLLEQLLCSIKFVITDCFRDTH